MAAAGGESLQAVAAWKHAIAAMQRKRVEQFNNSRPGSSLRAQRAILAGSAALLGLPNQTLDMKILHSAA